VDLERNLRGGVKLPDDKQNIEVTNYTTKKTKSVALREV
jgi:hypothetical protein